MKKQKLWMPVLAGLMIGQLSANGERPFKVINTIRAGYNDNLYRNASSEGSFFVSDTVDLSFRATLSGRTDMMLKSQLNLLSDTGDSKIYPNLYAMLNHSVSPRLLLGLSDSYISGEKSGYGSLEKNYRYNFFRNKAGVSADYVLTGKDRLKGEADYSMLRHEDDIQRNINLDTTITGAGLTWKRDIIQQRTYSSLSLRQQQVTYDHQESSYDETDLSVGLSHAFNPEWQGNIHGGVAKVSPSFSGSAENKDTLNPLFGAGLIYTPSPQTRLSGDFSYSYKPSDDSGYGGQTVTEFRLAAQHDITAKLMAKASARFATTEYDGKDSQTSTRRSGSDDRMDLELRFTYRLNRINYLELALKHNEKQSDFYSDWDQNIVDFGWRVELN